ncbi:MAG: branched-chain amino acid ABC transporter substrate-binding protein, partial [Moorea sp. SIO3G5]|nr:branched-chain amino acid ABC transporter substrate-binding protein [Moorena sp. SIO3G5]
FYDSNSDYSKDLKEKFETHFEQRGGKVIRDIKLNNPKLNIIPELKNLSQDQVKAAMLFPSEKNIETALNIAKANANLNPNNRNQQGLRLFGGDSLYNHKILKEGGEAVQGLTIVIPWSREESQANNFSEEAKEVWDGNVSWRTATSFDATQAFIQALFQDADREIVLNRLRNINLFPSDTSGFPLQFTDQGERESEPVLVKVVDGEFKELSE